MTDSPSSHPLQSHPVLSGNGLSRSVSVITEADVLITAALANRPARQPDLAAENKALHTLAQQLMGDPQFLLKSLVQIAKDLSQADTAGVSFLETLADGTSIFRWVAIAGALEFLEQTITPGNFSPCGTTIRQGQPQLYAHPEHYFTYLYHPQFPIVEALLFPLCVNNQPLGTLWILAHNQQRQFDREDQRLITSLAGFTANALQSIHLRQTAQLALQREQEILTQHKRAETSLRQIEEFNRQILNSSDDCIKILDLSGRLLYMNPRGQVLLTIEDITPFVKASWVEFWQGADREAAFNALETAKSGGVGSLRGYCPTLAGEPKWWDVKLTPIRGAEGQVERVLCISRDITEQKRIEEERHQNQERLRKNEERLSAIFSQAAVGLSEIRLDGRFERVNDELCKMLGRSREEILAASIADVTHSEDLPKSLKAFKQLIESGEPVSFDKRYLRPDGTIIWGNSSLTRLDDEQGRPQTVLVVTVDLSDRKQAELEIRKFVSLADHSTEFIGMCDMNFIPFYVNKAGTQMVGLDDVQQYSKTPVKEFFFPEDQDFILNEFFPQVLREGRAEVEIRFRHFKTGEALWMIYNVFYLKDENNQPIGLASVSHNITERKRAESAILERSRLSAMSADIGTILIQNDSLPDILKQCTEALVSHLDIAFARIWLLNQKKNVLELQASAGMYTHLDGSHSQVPVGQFKIGCIAQERQPYVTNNITGDPCLHNPQWAAQEGIVAFAGYPLIVENQVVGVMALFSRSCLSEITVQTIASVANAVSVGIQRKQIAAEREQLLKQEQAARAEAEAANRIKDEFLAVLSHELRSPLNPILGWSRLLQQGKLDAVRTAQALTTIERNAKLQAELIEDLLDVSRILQGKLSLNVSPVNLASTIRAALETVRLAAEAKLIDVQVNLDANVSSVMGDATRLQQVVWNLFSNAVKFTPVGGRVEVRLTQVDNQVQITVRDNGKGIPEEFLPYVFDYFRQADSAITRKFGGLGLGLAIVRHLVELHGGMVAADSAGEGLGATFTVNLPLMPIRREENPEEQFSDSASNLQGIQVLVVDDDTDTREVMVFILEEAGASVISVTSASEALAALTKSQPDLLLSDIGMPDMDGYMLMRQVRSLPPEQGGQIPAIALTAYAGEINKQQAMAAGFQHHIAKPVEPDEIIKLIAGLIGSKRHIVDTGGRSQIYSDLDGA